MTLGITSPATIVAIVATPTPNGGYWMLGRNGAVYAFGSAGFYGSVPGLPASEQPNTPVVGMAATANGKGYWIVTSAGDIYSFGDAAFHGSTGAITLNKPIVGMALDPATGGYWLDATDGGVFAFDAPFYGSMGGTVLDKPILNTATGSSPQTAGCSTSGPATSTGRPPERPRSGAVGEAPMWVACQPLR
ncbi:MAG: hypothetical protein M0Z40_14940 [Actinomycetota bacterium]|nr:hypothetical protein [Actinomycetota bacterium]